MIFIETYYLIDYENVGSDGLTGCKTLAKTDHIIIFFTNNARKIDMSDIANHGDADLEMIPVPAGKQSTDFHLASYLGFLAKTNNSTNRTIIIISKDADYDNVIAFWKKRTGIKAKRSQSIHVAKQKRQASQPNPSPSKNDSAVISSEHRQNINNQIMKALGKAGYSKEIVGYVASTSVKNIKEKNGKQNTYQSIIAKYGQKQGLAIYNHIKKII